MNSVKKYEESIEQEFFWNDNPPRKEMPLIKNIGKLLTKKEALERLNNITFAIMHDQKLLEQIKELKNYVKEKN